MSDQSGVKAQPAERSHAPRCCDLYSSDALFSGDTTGEGAQPELTRRWVYLQMTCRQNEFSDLEAFAEAALGAPKKDSRCGSAASRVCRCAGSRIGVDLLRVGGR